MNTALQVNKLLENYATIRQLSVELVSPLSEADTQIQSMEDASPSKWHLAHTSWFFETFILQKNQPEYQCYNQHFNFLFNSYYNGIGSQYTRSKRGLISRPTLAEIIDYRHFIDDAIKKLLTTHPEPSVLSLIELGLHHEQQHQELLLTDIKHAFFQNPSFPAYKPKDDITCNKTLVLDWLDIESGIYEIGSNGSTFCFDNEAPRHRIFLDQFKIASRPICNSEYSEFIEAGGYSNPEYWLSDGWAYIQKNNITQPYYWQTLDNQRYEFTLAGLKPLTLNAPVTHINYYEANAYANWANKRLPTEAEWEVAAQLYNKADHERCLSMDALHPLPATKDNPLQMTGDTWEWTSSAYTAYPGFEKLAGAVGEYNGKFMSNQYVLKGGSCVTPQGHIRNSYRNFFHPHQSWQFSGLRLASNK